MAYQRLEDSRLLLEQLDRPKPAIYLAGYAIECILKALLISRTPKGDRLELLRSFRGASGHDLSRLRHRLRIVGVHAASDIAEKLSLVSSWSTDLRYEPGDGDRDDADEFLSAAKDIIDWANQRM